MFFFSTSHFVRVFRYLEVTVFLSEQFTRLLCDTHTLFKLSVNFSLTILQCMNAILILTKKKKRQKEIVRSKAMTLVIQLTVQLILIILSKQQSAAIFFFKLIRNKERFQNGFKLELVHLELSELRLRGVMRVYQNDRKSKLEKHAISSQEIYFFFASWSTC